MFKEIFKKRFEKKYFSPGRINVIGEHIDYNGGFCLPIALNKGTRGFVSQNSNKVFAVFSKNFKEEGVYKIKIDDFAPKNKKFGWSNIFRGILFVLKDKLNKVDKGLNIYIEGQIPTGSGLSSSASIAMLFLEILNDYYHLNLTTLDKVYLTQKMENEYLGANTGILDQYVIGFAKENNALLLDCSMPSHKFFPLDFNKHSFLVVSTNKKRDLSESKYNQRVKECLKAKTILNENGFEIKNLCELKTNDLPKIEKTLNNEVLFKRAKHCITEQERTILASRNLYNLKELGKLLYQSHESLKNDYEVTGKHLDFIYDFSKSKDYVLGARMTGAGFGGSGIVLLPENKVDDYKKEFAKKYYEQFGIEPTFLITKSSNGVKCVK